MEIQRSFLLGGILITAFLLWNAWQTDYPKPQAVASVSTSAVPHQGLNEDVPNPVTGEIPAMPSTKATSLTSNHLITVKTDVLDILIDTQGGNFVSAKLNRYKQTIEPDSPPIQILNPDAQTLYISQSGLASNAGPDTPAEGQAIYQAKQESYEMAAGEDTLSVPLTWSKDGIEITKTFVFKRGDYLIDVSYEINNQSEATWNGQFYSQFKRADVPAKKESFFSMATFSGAAISTPEKRYEKISYKDLSKDRLNQEATGGWLAMVQHYFVSAWVPNPNQNTRIVSYPPQDNVYRVALLGPNLTVAPGDHLQTGAKFYVGPEIAETLKAISPSLELTIDYGWFWPIAQALFWVLQKFYDLLGNWGVAIIMTTLVIKLLFYKLSATSYRSMANMRRVQPKIEKLRERCGDDRQKMSQEMMALYKTEKINPLGGCLPILVQIPVFIALYWVLMESVELHHAPFVFWLQDLSAKDPYYVLPILMGISMFVQQRLSPAPPDPVQAKVLMMMPIVFTALFLTFPSGLVLYWVVNNCLSIAQQWFIMRGVEKGS
jgi:YidC/Oxa1 family membrane protein insertase